MKILFLSISDGEMSTSSNMYAALMREIVAAGHEVYAVSPCGKTRTKCGVEKLGDNLTQLFVKTLPLFGVGFIRKGLANVLLPYQFQSAIDKFYKGIKFDLIITPTPPITFANVVDTMKKRCGAKVYLILRDIFPQNAVDLGIMKKWWPIFWKFRSQEKKLYRVSDFIGCMSQGNIDYVKKHNPEVAEEKLHILENFQPLEPQAELDGEIRKKYGLEGKYVVIFGGNMGIPQKLENVIDLAKACEEYPDVLFLLVGKGMQCERIKQIAQQKGVKNVEFRDLIPQKDYQKLVAACDVGLISLNERFTIPNIPSKTLSYFNLSIPVLASLDAATDYGQILEKVNAGLWSLAGDLKSYKANFDKLYANPDLRAEMGRNGRKYLEENMTTEVACRILLGKVSAK